MPLDKYHWIMASDYSHQVEDLREKGFFAVVNGEKHWIEKGFKYMGQAKIWQLETVEGFKICATADQELLVRYFKGSAEFFRPICKIRKDDELILNRHGNLEWESYGLKLWAYGYPLGLLIGRGAINKTYGQILLHKTNWAPLSDTISDVLHDVVGRRGKGDHKNEYYISSKFLTYLVRHFELNPSREINSSLEEMSSEFYRGFLSGLFDIAATVDKNIRLIQSNKSRLEVVQRMLLRLGIYSTITKHSNEGEQIIRDETYGKSARYSLQPDVESFVRRIGFKHKEKKDLADQIKKQIRKEPFICHVKEDPVSTNQIKDAYSIQTSIPFDCNGFMTKNSCEAVVT